MAQKEAGGGSAGPWNVAAAAGIAAKLAKQGRGRAAAVKSAVEIQDGLLPVALAAQTAAANEESARRESPRWKSMKAVNAAGGMGRDLARYPLYGRTGTGKVREDLAPLEVKKKLLERMGTELRRQDAGELLGGRSPFGGPSLPRLPGLPEREAPSSWTPPLRQEDPGWELPEALPWNTRRELQRTLAGEREDTEREYRGLKGEVERQEQADWLQNAEKTAREAEDFSLMVKKGKENSDAAGNLFTQKSLMPFNEVEFINHLQEAGEADKLVGIGAERTARSGNDDPKKYLYLTPEERDIYAYYLAVDRPTAERYLEAMDDAMNYRADLVRGANARQLGRQHPVQAGIASTVMKPIAAVGETFQTVEEALGGKDPSPYSGWHGSSGQVRSMRDGTLEQADGDFERMLLNSLYQTADALPAAALSKVSPALGLSYSGVLSGSDAIGDAAADGKGSGEALLNGLGAAAWDIALEKLPLEKLSNLLRSGQEDAAKGVLTELLEKAGVSTAKDVLKKEGALVYDEFLNQEKSQVRQYQQELIKTGVTEQEALRKAREKFYGTDAFQEAVYGSLFRALLSGAPE